MKTLISLITLTAIVTAYIFSISLYQQGESVIAYTLVMLSITGFAVWVNHVSMRLQKLRG